MTQQLLGPWIRRFLLEHLVGERNLARNTQRSYRDTFCLLIPFAAEKLKRAVDKIKVTDLSAELVRAFTTYLKEVRNCGTNTHNQRLAAIHALALFIGNRSPEHLAWCSEVRLVPFKKAPWTVIDYLDKPEMEAMLAAANLNRPQGRRDHALLLFLYNSGARAEEAAQLKIVDLHFTPAEWNGQAYVQILGKGGRTRQCPLWPATVREINALIANRQPHEPVFLNRLLQRLQTRRHLRRGKAVRTKSGRGRAFNCRQTSQPAHHSTHDSDAFAEGRCGHQHHPGLVGPCLPQHYQHLCRDRLGDEGESAGQMRSGRR